MGGNSAGAAIMQFQNGIEGRFCSGFPQLHQKRALTVNSTAFNFACVDG
jgi:hypothetical protein